MPCFKISRIGLTSSVDGGAGSKITFTCVFAQMSGRVAAASERATFEHDLVTRLAGAAGRTRRNRLPPPSRPNRPGRPKGRPPGSLAWPRDLGLPGDHCGSRRVSTISLQIMINLRFSLWETRRRYAKA
jgi:hypothetical protein